MLQLTSLKTLHQNRPVLDVNPYFSWMLCSDAQNTVQTAYRISVAAQGDKTRVLWDTGVIESDTNCYISYAGEALASRTVYQWTVTVWDNHGETATESAEFETGLLNAEDWKADWVASPLPVKQRGKGFGNQNPSTLFRWEFTAKAPVQSARVYTTCHGVYQLTVNGTKPDDRELAPEYSSYTHYLCYQTYDVTSLVRAGRNAIGLHVADGWYFAPETTMDRNLLGDPHAVLFQIELQYGDGSTEIIGSDEQVHVAPGPVAFSSLFAGEKFDANVVLNGWDEPDFDDSAWVCAKKAAYGVNNLAAQISAPIKVVKTLPAKTLTVSPKGETIIDFGQNLAGRVRMKVHAPKGTEITLEHCEVLDKEGNYFNNILGMAGVGEGCDQKIVYVSDGAETEYAPMFSFQGFRYIRVSGLQDVRLEDFTAEALSSEKEPTGSFSCSDPRLNRLYENTLWSQRSNMISIPTDCPQREKAGWTGDISIYALTSLMNEDTTPFLTQWLKSLACDQKDQGAVPIVVPFNQTYQDMLPMLRMMGQTDGPVASAAWGDAAVNVPWSMYLATGNTAILSQQYESMKDWCDYIISSAKNGRNEQLPPETDQYLWNTGFHFGEWLIPSTAAAGYDSDAPMVAMGITKQYVAPISGWVSVSTMAKIAGILHKDEDAAYYGDFALRMEQALRSVLVREDGTMISDFMGAYVMALYYDLISTERREEIARQLLALIEKNGGCLDTGFVATPLILDALCKIGRQDKAYDLLFQTRAPSWLGELEQGATTIWESWLGYDADGNPLVISQNHYAFGCVDDWMFRHINGLVPSSAGYKSFLVKPAPDHRLSGAERIFLTENGRIETKWEKQGSSFALSVTVPCNTTATVILPNGEEHRVGSGSYRYSCTLSEKE